jgi:thiamine biosynthesis lipoprotein
MNTTLLRILTLIAITFSHASCTQKAQKEYIHLNGFTQGTTFSIVYYNKDGKDFSTQVDSIFAAIDTSMSVYNQSSVIVAFNNSQNGYELDPLLTEVVKQSFAITAETNGAFDITVGPLVKAWGFHIKRGEMPTNEKVQELLSFTGSDKVELKETFLAKKHPKAMIDVNAIAQGFTVDVVGMFLEENGVTDYLVEVGGEVRTLGKSPRAADWIVGVDKPVDDALSGDNLQVKISLSGQSLVTSGNYRKFFVRDGIKYSHTIDPKTGYPVNHTLLSATVLDKTGARADALATAFMVIGVDSTKKWLGKHKDIQAYLIFSDSTGDYRVWMTPEMKEMIVD